VGDAELEGGDMRTDHRRDQVRAPSAPLLEAVAVALNR
jgi:hypothetical protein